MRRPLILLAFLAAVAFLAWRLVPIAPASREGRVRVVATIYPLAEFARAVGGGLVDVRTLVAAGSEPHDYEPTPRDIVAADEADVFLMNGGIDAWAERILPQLRDAGVDVERMADAMPEIAEDPHAWIDPVRAVAMVDLIHEALVERDPAHAEAYAVNAARYRAELQGLDEAYRQGLASCASRKAFVSHDTLEYLAARYGFEAVPIAGLSPDEEPSPKRMAEISALAKEAGAKYILFEELTSPKLAQTVADEVGAGTLAFNPIEGLTPAQLADGQDYLSAQRSDIDALRRALDCR